MKVYLICAPIWTKDRIALSLATLQAYLKKEGHDVRVFDLSNIMFKRNQNRFLLLKIIENLAYIYRDTSHKGILLGELEKHFESIPPADAYCFSIYRTNLRNSLAMAKSIKQHKPEAKIVFGGPHCYFSYVQKLIRDSGLVDHIVIGEGELDLIDLLRNLHVEGYLIHHKILPNLEYELMPDFSGINLKNYRQELPYSTSRGCHNPCTYCFDRIYWVKYRYKSAKKIYHDLKKLKEIYRIDAFLFSDSTCFGTKEKLLQFCSIVVENKFKISWGSQTRFFDLTEEELNLIRKSGCTWLSIGVESYSLEVIGHMRKGYNIGKIERFIRKAHILGIKIRTCYMVGYPNETWRDFFITLRFILRNRKYVRNASISWTMIYEGTYLYNNADNFGIKNKDSIFWRSERSNAFNRLLKYFILKSVNHLFVRKKKRWLRKPIT